MRTLRPAALPFTGTASLIALAVGLTRTPAHAQADPRAEAQHHHDRGWTEYNLGRFDKAIAEFERAYELDPDPSLLFNMAQVHRRAGSYDKAIFFFERYLLLAKDAPEKSVADARRRIEELRRILDERAAAAPEPAARDASTAEAPPAGPSPSPATNAPTPTRTPPSAGVGASDAPTVRAQAPADPRPAFVLAVGAGVGRLSLTGANEESGHTVSTFAVEAARLVGLASYTLRFGLLGQYASFEHDGGKTGVPLTFRFPGLFATGALGRGLGARAAIGLQVAAGAVWWSGLGEGNGVTLDGAGATGAVPMPAARVGLSLEQRFGRAGGVVVRLAPAYLVCLTTSGLSESVSQVRVLQILAELGYAW